MFPLFPVCWSPPAPSSPSPSCHVRWVLFFSSNICCSSPVKPPGPGIFYTWRFWLWVKFLNRWGAVHIFSSFFASFFVILSRKVLICITEFVGLKLLFSYYILVSMIYNRSFFQFLKFCVMVFFLTLASKQFYHFINLIKEPIFGFIDFSQFFSFPILLSFACPNSFFLLWD